MMLRGWGLIFGHGWGARHEKGSWNSSRGIKGKWGIRRFLQWVSPSQMPGSPGAAPLP